VSLGIETSMYESFYGLRERPFDLTPNPRFLFLTPRHREALSTLRYGLSAHRGMALLLGEAGTGKTTVVRAALAAEQRPANRYVLLSNPTLSRLEFYEYLATGFKFTEQAARSKARFLFELQHDAQERFAAGGVTALIIDEAQSLPHELLEEIRLLANIETATAKLLNVILVGQPELAERLNDPSLRQLKQRVTLRCELAPLGVKESMAYIAVRLRIAGGNAAEIFTREAVLAVHEAARGLPRTISVVCENALLSGFAAHRKPIDEALVHEVTRDFALEGAGPAAQPAATTGSTVPPAETASFAGNTDPPAPAITSRPSSPPLAVASGEGRAPMFSQFTRRRRFIFF
jgi:general secretion pathway protein A